MEEFLAEHVWTTRHWPFLAVAVVLMLVGQVAKAAVWTKFRARNSRPQWFWWWGYKTMPVHPVVVGAIIGLLWRTPEEGLGTVASVGYFAFSGALSVWLFQILKGVAKRRGIDLDLPGGSVAPSTAPSKPPDPEDEEQTPKVRP